MATVYLAREIAEAKRTAAPQYGLTQSGYTLRSGAPTTTMIRLAGEKRWRRMMVWCFSNAGTCFVRIGGVPHIVPSWAVPCDLPIGGE